LIVIEEDKNDDKFFDDTFNFKSGNEDSTNLIFPKIEVMANQESKNSMYDLSEYFSIKIIESLSGAMFNLSSLYEQELDYNLDYFLLVEMNTDNFISKQSLKSNFLTENQKEFNLKQYFTSKYLYLDIFTQKKLYCKLINFSHIFKIGNQLKHNPKKSNVLINDSIHVSFFHILVS